MQFHFIATKLKVEADDEEDSEAIETSLINTTTTEMATVPSEPT